MSNRRVFFSFLSLLAAPAYLTVAAPSESPLDAPCPVDWRAVPLIEAVRQLAVRLDMPYILDAAVTEEMISRPVRLSAAHLNGRQAFRWTVRLAGLDAVAIDGAMMIAPPDRLPASWKLAGVLSSGGTGATSPASGPGTGSDPRLEALRAKRVDIAWADSPLSRVTRDTSERFGLDLIFDPLILEDQPLVRLNGAQLDWSAVEQALRDQLEASCDYEDGAVWVRPRGSAASQPATAPAGPGLPSAGQPDGTSVLSRQVEISLVDADAGKIQETFSRSVGINCRVEDGGGGKLNVISARGTLFEVLEGLRILEGWAWEIAPPGRDGGPILLIHMSDSSRSVG